jgi:hypothetical protein
LANDINLGQSWLKIKVYFFCHQIFYYLAAVSHAFLFGVAFQ